MTTGPLYIEPPPALVHPRPQYLFSFLGPGLIIASVTIGSGELVFASRSGAIFGYNLLWCFLYAGVFKAIQVYSAARYITLTGEHPMTAWTRLPGPPLWFPLLIAVPAVLVMPIAFSALPEMLAGFIRRLVDSPEHGPEIWAWQFIEFWENFGATVVLVVCLVLAVCSSYQLLERLSALVLGAIVVCVGISIVVLHPNLFDLVRGMIWPTNPEYPDWILNDPPHKSEFSERSPWLEVSLYLSAVGGGTYDYIGYVGMIRQKKWGLAGRACVGRAELEKAVGSGDSTADETVRRARTWTRAPLVDTSLSFLFVILVTLMFGILGALVLHPEKAVPTGSDLLTEQEGFLTVLNPHLRWLYLVGVLLAFIGTIYGAFAVYRYTLVESVKAVAPRLLERLPGLGDWLVAYFFVGGLIMVWLPERISGDIVPRVTVATIISGATSSGLWCFAMLWVDRVCLPRQLRMSLTGSLLVFVAGTGMTILGIQTILAYFELV